MLYKELTDWFIEDEFARRGRNYAIMCFGALEQFAKVYANCEVAKELRNELRYDDNNTVVTKGEFGEDYEIYLTPSCDDIIQIAEELVNKYYEDTDVLFPIDAEEVIDKCLLRVLNDMSFSYEFVSDEDEDEYDF